jgi:hypothetical protein
MPCLWAVVYDEQRVLMAVVQLSTGVQSTLVGQCNLASPAPAAPAVVPLCTDTTLPATTSSLAHSSIPPCLCPSQAAAATVERLPQHPLQHRHTRVHPSLLSHGAHHVTAYRRWWLPLWGIRRGGWWRPPIYRPGWGFPGGIRPPGKPGWRPGHRPEGWTNRVAGGAFGLAGRRPSGPLYRDPALGGGGPRSGTRPIGGESWGLKALHSLGLCCCPAAATAVGVAAAAAAASLGCFVHSKALFACIPVHCLLVTH